MKKQLLDLLKRSIQTNLYAENLTWMQKVNFVSDAYQAKGQFITNQIILDKMGIKTPYDGMILLLLITPAKEALQIVKSLDKLQDELGFVPDTGELLTYLFNKMEL